MCVCVCVFDFDNNGLRWFWKTSLKWIFHKAAAQKQSENKWSGSAGWQIQQADDGSLKSYHYPHTHILTHTHTHTRRPTGYFL